MRGRSTCSLGLELEADADTLAFDREPDDYRGALLVELHLLERAHTIARRYLYEEADASAQRPLCSRTTPNCGPGQRRSTAKRPITACTLSCGRRACATSRGSEAALEELWPFALGVLEPETATRAGAAHGFEAGGPDRTAAPTCWS